MTDVEEDNYKIASTQILNGETAERLEVWEDTPKGHATPTFAITLDMGWAERPIATGLYEHDAVGIAHALAEAFDCGVLRR